MSDRRRKPLPSIPELPPDASEDLRRARAAEVKRIERLARRRARYEQSQREVQRLKALARERELNATIDTIAALPNPPVIPQPSQAAAAAPEPSQAVTVAIEPESVDELYGCPVCGSKSIRKEAYAAIEAEVSALRRLIEAIAGIQASSKKRD